MKNNNFYKRFLKKTESDLLNIIDNSHSYSEGAVEAAQQILKEREVNVSVSQRKTIEDFENKKEREKEIQAQIKKESKLSPFVKRLIAFFIDIVFLSLVSTIIGYLLSTTSLVNSFWEPFLSLSIVLTYFSVFNSKMFGQTIGKSVLKIQVTKYTMEPLNLQESLFRYALLVAPYFILKFISHFNINDFGLVSGMQWAYYLGIFFFIITDQKLHRCFHDLATQSFVTDYDFQEFDFNYPKKKIKTFWLVGTLAVSLTVIVHSVNSLDSRQQSNNNNYKNELHNTFEREIQIISKITPEIKKVEGVGQIEKIEVYTTTDNDKVLQVTYKPSIFGDNTNTANQIHQILLKANIGKDQFGTTIITSHTGFNLTLAFYDSYENTEF